MFSQHDKLGYSFDLLKAGKDINFQQRGVFLDKIKDLLWIIKDKTIGVLGLAFKPDTDDIRNAPSIDIINALTAEGAKIRVYDPSAMKKAKEVFGDNDKIRFCKDSYDACRGSDCVLLVTEWDEFKELDFGRIKKLLKRPLVVDGRNIYDPEKMKKMGFTYVAMGRKGDLGK